MTSLKNQGRDAPAFQEYAASMMSRLEYRLLNLSQRGLLYTLRLECWVNQSLPRDPKKLATVLGLPLEEVTAAIPSLKDFFHFNGESLTCLELEKYREHVQDRRNRQSDGGKESRRRYKEKMKSMEALGIEATSMHDKSNIQTLSPNNSIAQRAKIAFGNADGIQGSNNDNDFDIPF